jgi:hypothetical protein
VLAFLAQLCLKKSVWIAYTQWMWSATTETGITVKGLTAVFEAESSIFSLLNMEMLKKVRVGSAMACLAW